MKVSLDGGLTWQESDEVRVSYDVDIPNGNMSCPIEGELLVNCTHEGLIMDVNWFDANGATSSETAQEIVDRLTNEECLNPNCECGGNCALNVDDAGFEIEHKD